MSLRALKFLAGIVLGAIGMFFVVGCLALMFEENVGRSALWIAAAFILGGLLPIGGAIVLLKGYVGDIPVRPCPSCDGCEHAPAGVLVKGGSWLLLHTVGLPISLLMHGSRRKQVRCVVCNTLFYVETKGTRLSNALLWIFVLFFGIAVVAERLRGL